MATAIGSNTIPPAGHVAMVAAVQPFLSGGVSTTVNLPADASVEDVEAVLVDAWSSRLKAVSVYRQGSKPTQPLTVGAAQRRPPHREDAGSSDRRDGAQGLSPSG